MCACVRVLCVWVHVRLRMYVSMYICNLYVYVCLYVCEYVYMSVHVCVLVIHTFDTPAAL